MDEAPLSFRLDGKVAVVTGAARGIGAAIARAYAAAGAKVVVFDRNGDGARAVAANLPDALAVAGDAADPGDVARAFDATLARFGRLDILVNNAGTSRPEDIFEITLESWNEILRINLTSAFLCSKRAMEIMRGQGSGAIIVLGSISGHQGALYGHLHYSTTKSGLHAFARTLARTAAPLGITVNAIAPGIVETDLLYATHGAEGVAELAKKVPRGLAKPADIGAAAVYLASPAGRHVTGAVLDVNGGIHMR